MRFSTHFLLLSALAVMDSGATGLIRDGRSARTQALGGAEVATARSPLESVFGNPANLGIPARGAVEIGLDGVFVRSTLRRPGEVDSHLKNRVNFLGDVAISIPTRNPAIHWGLGASPSHAASTDWHYRDREGGLDGKTSYGEIDHRSEFLVYDMRAAVAVEFSKWFSAGLSAGVVYNHNSLETAYIFQSQETLRGFKTKINLDTEGYAAIGQIGITVRPTSALTFSAAYTSPSQIHTKGDLHADLSAQLQSLGNGWAAVNPRLNADARVLTKLPQKVALGVAWQVTPKLKIASEFDWIQWSQAFDELPLTLNNSSNAAVNALVGSNRFRDVASLRWRDQKIIRVGLEYDLDEQWSLRAGYARSSQVVPAETLTPLAEAIDQSLVSAGLGYRWSKWHADLSWQWHLPQTRKINQSALRSGEYSQNELELESTWLGLTLGRDF